MENMKFCQSCGMVLDNSDVIGTNLDNSKNNDYCIYCYENGQYTSDCSMEEMIETSVKHMKDSGMLVQQNKTEEEARQFMSSFFPDLKRWQVRE